MTVGSTFWSHGDLDANPPFHDHTVLNQLAAEVKGKDDGNPCEMLLWIDDRPTCAIELFAGRRYKPSACRDQPDDGELCQRERNAR